MFDENYYINSTISNYSDYREKKFTGLANDLFPYLRNKIVLDYGAATGGLVHSLRELGISCVGTDISYWAITYGRKHYGLPEDVLQLYNMQLLEYHFDTVLFLDVLEHIPNYDLNNILEIIKAPQIIVRIPVSSVEGEDFVLDVSKNDKTHIQVHAKEWWFSSFREAYYTEFLPLSTDNIYDSEGVMAGIFYRN